MKYLKYLSYVLRHKWYVLIECFKIGLILEGLVHDLSKFSPKEFIPYARFFYGDKFKTSKEGYFKDNDQSDKDFDLAWLNHQKMNKHHWQWWLVPMDKGLTRPLEMPKKYVDEMICDWEGAGKAQKVKGTIQEWYKKYKNKMQLHPETAILVEKILAERNK